MREEIKIICGFAGIGKSYLAKNKERFVDLESTPFNKNWDLYTNVAIHMQANGYYPMLSCHKEMRNILKEKNANYIVILPKKEHKENYLKRYRERGNTDEFIKLFEDNFEKFIDQIIEEEDNIFFLEDKNYTLSDVLNLLN